MTDRPANWRMPTAKQIQKMAAVVGGNVLPKPGLALDDDLPPEYWQALLDDPRAEARSGPSGGALRLSQIPQHILRVSCRRCARIVEIQRSMPSGFMVRRPSGGTSASACWTTLARSGPGVMRRRRSDEFGSMLMTKARPANRAFVRAASAASKAADSVNFESS